MANNTEQTIPNVITTPAHKTLTEEEKRKQISDMTNAHRQIIGAQKGEQSTTPPTSATPTPETPEPIAPTTPTAEQGGTQPTVVDPNSTVDNPEGAAGATPQTTPLEGVGNVLSGEYETARTNAINKIYESQMAARKAELEAAFNRSNSSLEQAAKNIPKLYQDRANDLSTQYERNRRNLNLQAAGNGINTGAASQQALALNSVYQREYGANARAQADAQAQSDATIADLKVRYETDMAAAIAQNDYQKAGALLDEYNEGYMRNLQNAQILAEFGDFSGYAALYGQEQADNMLAIWRSQNPDLAWNVGKISGEEYHRVTGKYPRGYKPVGGGVGYNPAEDLFGYGGSMVSGPSSPPYGSGGSGAGTQLGKALDNAKIIIEGGGSPEAAIADARDAAEHGFITDYDVDTVIDFINDNYRER